MMETQSPLTGWIPYKLFHENGYPLCRWLNVSDYQFTDPFFTDTIEKCKSKFIYRQHSVSSVEVLPDWSGQLSYVPPTAFIFHISRCGSTLLAQLLGINPSNIVLSEVPFFDEILREPYKRESTLSLRTYPALEAALKFYGQCRNGSEKMLFIKTDSWHVFFYKKLRELYPNVPFVLLYRQPAEVIRSQQKKRGMQAVPGVIEPAIFGFNNESVTDLDEYMTRVIRQYLKIFLQIVEEDQNSILVNYHDGMLKVMEQVAAYTGMTISPEEYKKMKERCGYHGKYPEQLFTEESGEMEETPSLKQCYELYRKLEEKRSGMLVSSGLRAS
ncbi:MAG TPA: hypothetical protein VGD17_14875 [Chitinophagaceae bacterium]